MTEKADSERIPAFIEVALVIPAYNEARRLPNTLNVLKRDIAAGSQVLGAAKITEVIIVDDGSQDNTLEVANGFARDFTGFRVVASGRNYGKGHAIHLGMRAARADYILIADADMATPWGEARKLAMAMLQNRADITFGSRDIAGAQVVVHQSWIRECLGKTFNFFVRAVTGLPFRDTQCGFKLFKRSSLSRILPNLVVDNFAWDVETLIYAQRDRQRLIEVPIEWHHQDESRVRPVRDGLRMVATVIKIRLAVQLGNLAAAIRG